MRLFVGNFPYTITERDLHNTFGVYGEVTQLQIVMDRELGRSKGFAFIEMEDRSAIQAMNALNGAEWGGRTLKVAEAKPREPRQDRTPQYAGRGHDRGQQRERR